MAKLLSTSQAVFIGLASMLGAGVFSVFGVAAGFAGPSLPLAVLVAGAVAYLNAMSISQLAVSVPRSGGSYAYARHYISNRVGFIAGASFLIGKIGSVGAIAITFANYLTPSFEKGTAILAILAMTLLNVAGLNRTALGAKVSASIILGFLALVIIVAIFTVPATRSSLTDSQLPEFLTAASMFFFAFAGYARVSTLASEVRNPEITIPKAIKISLGIVFTVYLLLSMLLPLHLGGALQTSKTAISDLVIEVLPPAAQFVWVFASIAALGSLLALLAGIGRTTAVMAEDGELPKFFSQRNGKNAPWLAELVMAVLAMGLVLSGSFMWVVGISSCSVLLYYAIAHWAALKQPIDSKGRSKSWAWLGLFLCITLAAAVPLASIMLSLAALALLLLLRELLAMRRSNH